MNYKKLWQKCKSFFVGFSEKYKIVKYRYVVLSVGSILAGFIVADIYLQSQIKVYYSLDKRQNDLEIIKVIDQAHRYIYFAIYYFSKNNIAEALERAKKRGVEVYGIMDREASKDVNKHILEELNSNGVKVLVSDNSTGLMHIKTLVTENAYVTGSYNWTQSATVNNDEVLELGSIGSIRKRYLEIIKKLINKNGGKAMAGVADAEVRHMQGQIYDYTEAPNHIGENATIKGEIKKVYTAKSGVTFLDYCSNYKKCPFTAVIFADDKDRIKDLDKIKGVVQVSGEIKEYGGKAEIVIEDQSQLAF